MNFNALIAVLVLKSVLTEDEAERLVEHLNDKPQSTVLRDAIAAVAEVIGKPQPSILPPIGPVGPAQMQEELAARAQTTTAGSNDVVADPPATIDQAPAPAEDKPAEVVEAEKTGGETYTPESEKDAKSTPVKKSTDETPKK
jgi:hypothetical protein